MKKILKSIYLIIESLYRIYLRKRVKNKNFTIISNNCWSGAIYQDLGLQKLTPTVDLFFYIPCYIKFVSNLKYYIDSPLLFKTSSFYESANEKLKKHPYPVGIINDIEIHFLHYTSKAEALEKWNRRIKRINYDNLFFVLSDRDLCTIEHIREFDNLPYKNKIIFSSKNYPEIKSLIWLKIYKKDKTVGDLYKYRWSYRYYFNVAKWLNNQQGDIKQFNK